MSQDAAAKSDLHSRTHHRSSAIRSCTQPKPQYLSAVPGSMAPASPALNSLCALEYATDNYAAADTLFQESIVASPNYAAALTNHALVLVKPSPDAR